MREEKTREEKTREKKTSSEPSTTAPRGELPSIEASHESDLTTYFVAFTLLAKPK
jgi:hypothetical protein